MSYTYTTNVGDGVTKDFPFSFAGQDVGYLAPSNILVFIAGTPVGNYSISPSSPNVVRFDTAPALGAEVLIRRIMPKNVPYADFSRGNPFSQDTLNNTNLQMLYLIQEIYDGYLPQGFFFRVDIDMRGHKLINLGDGSADGDSVNMKQHKTEVVRNDAQDGRLTALEDNIVAGEQANFFAQLYKATGGETTINTTNGLFCAALYIQGLYQHKIAGAYSQVGAAINFAQPLKAGWEVYLILGTDLPSDSIYATIESVAALQGVVDDINSKYAKKGANNDITSLTGLTTPLTKEQGGTGNATGEAALAVKLKTARSVRTQLDSTTATDFDGSANITPGVNGTLPVGNGGTGNTVGRSATATKLDVPRGLRVNLASTSAVNFDGSADATPGVTGTLPLTNGGLGATTVAGAQSALDIFPATGKADASNAAAGRVGEYLSAQTSTPVGLSSNTAASVVSILLTPGDWDLEGVVNVEPAGGAALAQTQASLSLVATGVDVFPYRYQAVVSTSAGRHTPIPGRRVNVTVNTTVYLVVAVIFSSGSATGQGFIKARRVR